MNGEEAPEDRLQRERVGVAGDPVPDHEYGDQGRPPGADVDPGDGYPGVSRSVCRAADDVAAHGVVTYRQAVAWVLRDVEGVGREETAERMDCSVSNLDTLLGRARDNIGKARRTASIADELEADE
ncbi:ORF 51 [Haloarcula hispanica virus SH1]|uniref:ORF 51 n=1 Tax=Haloarcula hispanica SH1 virus TaxID=326574 RepID=Q4KPD6_9VIRU|nr:ORF 51 [Haloarcula hispanica virus SH1]AAY24977.1 ORF 51 [Haloarcula hispanica virus SH1]